MILTKFNMQKKISTILLVVGIFALLGNILAGLIQGSQFKQIFTNSNFLILAGFILLLAVTRKINSKIIRMMQVAIFFLNSILAIIDQYNSFYGLGLYTMGILIMYRYRYFEKYTRSKIISLILLIVITIELSSYIEHKTFNGASITVNIFIFFFLFFIYFLFQDELNNILFKDRKMKRTLEELIIEKNRYLHDIKVFQDKIISLEKSIVQEHECQMSKYKFTLKEEEIIELLCTKKMSNKELSDFLYISEGTVKQHLSNIYHKCNVNKRIKVIYLFENCFNNKTSNI